MECVTCYSSNTLKSGVIPSNPTQMNCVPSRISSNKKECKYFFFRYADKVSIFDEVLCLANDRVIAVRVKNISNIYLQGDCTDF